MVRSLSEAGSYQMRLASLILSFFLLFWILASPVSAIVTAQKNPDLTEGRFTIGLREELGENAAEIEKILRANPRVRIGWPSEYEISADPRYPDNFYLIDMNYRAASSAYRHWAQGPDGDEPVRASPIFLGRLDDGSFASGLERVLRDITRRWELVSLDRIQIYQHGAAIDIDCIPSQSCVGPRQSNLMRTGIPNFLEIKVFEGNPKPQFLYVLMIKPDHQLQWVFQTTVDNPVQPGAVFDAPFADQSFMFEQPGRYEFLTISSEKPIDTALLAPDNPVDVDRARCKSVLERVLCRAISGVADPTLPEEAWHRDIGWNINTAGYYASLPPEFAVGGGEEASPGYAPWAVQIFSNRPYTPEQEIEDAELLDSNPNKKFLANLTEGQEEHRCGGSLIFPDVVLTAAHCVTRGSTAIWPQILQDRRVLLGTQTIGDIKEGAIYAIDAVVFHADYQTSTRNSPPHNDIALLKVRPLGRRLPPQPIALPNGVPGFQKTKRADLVEVLGWGFTETRQGNQAGRLNGGKPLKEAIRLQKGALSFLDTAQCQKIPNYEKVTAKHICAITPPKKQATRGADNTFSCRGDSGGPVIRWVDRKRVQVGVVSWAYGCGALAASGAPVKRNPSLFVNVEAYTVWIDRARNSFASGQVSKVR